MASLTGSLIEKPLKKLKRESGKYTKMEMDAVEINLLKPVHLLYQRHYQKHCNLSLRTKLSPLKENVITCKDAVTISGG